MATNTRTQVLKNGVPVKRFWREKITQKAREQYYTTTYPIYFTSSNSAFRSSSLTNENAPRSLVDAERIAKAVVEDATMEWTHATIYEMRAMVRYGTELDWKQAPQPKWPVWKQMATTTSTDRES